MPPERQSGAAGGKKLNLAALRTDAVSAVSDSPMIDSPMIDSPMIDSPMIRWSIAR
jgi:hypothetical protein